MLSRVLSRLIATWALLTTDHRPSSRFRILVSNDNPESAGRLLVHGLAWLCLLPVFYRTVFHFLTAYHHKGLAALALSLTVTALGVLSILAVRCLANSVASGLARLCVRMPLLKRPAFALVLVCIAWLAAIVPPLARGPDATGVYGFIGLLAKDGLESDGGDRSELLKPRGRPSDQNGSE
ncbi:MAG: hypothetical protein GY847_04315 [Proteobacteria bacterium]|nr:hypothetical protein [Pseudomonadota bacterium]